MKKKIILFLFVVGLTVLFLLKWQPFNQSKLAYHTNVSSDLTNLSGFLSQHSAQSKLSPVRDMAEIVRLKNSPHLLDSVVQVWNDFEKTSFLQKNTFEWLQLTGQLFRLTNSSTYIDELELFAYNHLLGDQYLIKTNQPKYQYLTEKTANALKYLPHYYSGSIQEKLLINFYEAGAYVAYLNISGKNKKVKYYLDTNYPSDGTIELSFYPKKPTKFTLSLRVPGWCNLFEVHIEEEVYKGKAGQYLDISRTWEKGDVVRVCANMKIEKKAQEVFLHLQRGPQILVAAPELQQKANLPDDWQGRQIYQLNTIEESVNEIITLVPYADACQLGKKPSLAQDSLVLVQELPSENLERLRIQLAAFRDEFGGANDMPAVPFFFFGMGNRPKYIYRDGKLVEAISRKIIRSWSVSKQVIIPNDYRVELLSLDGKNVSIYENETGIFIQEGTQPPLLLNGTNAPVKLPPFEAYRYDQILKVLHHEILINIVNSEPLPNFLVYQKAWRRDAAMMAMCLEATDNLALIKDWVLSLDSPYDYNNQMDGIQEEEADNLGQTLYLLSLFSNKEHPLVNKILEEVPKFEKSKRGKKYIKGRTDFGYHPAYQTKWLKFGLHALALPDNYEVPNINDGYNTLFWWDYQNPDRETEAVEVWRYYPYISWAKDHYFGTKNSPISNRDYPLTWEIEASQADYEKMKIVDSAYYLGKNASPHTWHTAEVFLYLLEFKK